MREIKFRCWDTDKKCWMKQENPQGNPLSNHFISFDGWVWDRKNINGGSSDSLAKREFVLCQFTGLKDKNGKEIYEGDIVRCGDYVEDADAWNEWEREVTWDEENGSWLGIDGERNEVIGNIYENPELLIPSNTSNK